MNDKLAFSVTNQNFEILPVNLLLAYAKAISPSLNNAFEKLTDAEISTSDFSFYTSVSSVYSSKIEGEDIELDSYVKHKRFGVPFSPDYTKKTDDLYEAYLFAQQSPLAKENIEKAHVILTRHLLAKHWQGKTRKQNMFVTSPEGQIEYVAALPQIVEAEMGKLYADIKLLTDADLGISDVFFFASLIHLVFVKIHPFNDGNGRTARLIEKWFLAQRLGAKAWFIQSEKYYYLHQQMYYRNIRSLGIEYPYLDYDKALPFLLMLPQCMVN